MRILLDARTFNDEFVPETIPFREQYEEDILDCIGPMKQNMPARNVYVFGPPGSGKTTVVKSILQNQFKGQSVYINCWNSSFTNHRIMAEILKHLGQVVHGKESTSNLIERFEMLDRRIVVCLDEFESLRDKSILHLFVRRSCPLVLIGNNPFSPFCLDAKTRSIFFVKEVEFDPYEPGEIRDILFHRIETGLNKQSVTDDLVDEIARSSSGDARTAFQILKEAALEAETKEHPVITIDHIRAATKCARKYRLSYLLGKLNPHQKLIYEILKESKSMDSGSLFNEYRKLVKETVTDRSYRNYMQKLVELGLVRESSSGRWKKYDVVT